MATTIFVMTHKAFQPPEDPVYKPLQVGRATGEDLGFLGDDTGDNISEYNCYFGELTGLYWIWKNYKGRENIGICHYRRYFTDERHLYFSSDDFDRILSEYDVITSNRLEAEKIYWKVYGDAHHIEDMQAVGEAIKKIYPQDYDTFISVMEGIEHYYGNLMVMPRDTFDDYCKWLFDILFEVSHHIDPTEYPPYHRRVYGFLSENLLLVYIRARGLRPYESTIGCSEEKVESRDLVLATYQLLKMGQIDEAYRLFSQIVDLRPDVTLPMSDIYSRVVCTEQILFTLVAEEKAGVTGMWEVSHDLLVLIDHYKKVFRIFSAYSEGSPMSDEDFSYLKDTFVSAICAELMVKSNLSKYLKCTPLDEERVMGLYE
ncbi:MAG: DUF4422 domain-containing protein [Lachnospiraceae bacterium]|nr:DUF4422 domain-containing protein [Lachnospiraceae bacterium]